MDYEIELGESSNYPKRHYGGHIVQGIRATFCEKKDLRNPSANVLAIPGLDLKVLKNDTVAVPKEFFGQHTQNILNVGSDGLSYGTVRTHDIRNSASQWRKIEPSDNVWDFSAMDVWIDTHYRAGREIIFTLFGTPTWASARQAEKGAYGDGALGAQAEPLDMTKWDRFCTKIAERYKDKVKIFEVWNEPNFRNNGSIVITNPSTGQPYTDFFFSGTWAKLSEMTRRASQAIKAVDPTAKIICPPTTSWSTTAGQTSELYFTGMMNAATGDGSTTMKDHVDIIGVHLYQSGGGAVLGSTLAETIDRVNAVKTTLGITAKETWDTESGPISTFSTAMSDDELRRYFLRFYLTLAAKDVKRTCYYSYDSSLMGFVGRPGVVQAWNEVRELLMSGKIQAVSRLNGAVCHWVNDVLYIDGKVELD